MIRLCGACLGLFAFSVTILQGILAGNPVEVTLIRGLWAMLGFCCIGLATGWVASRVLDEHAIRRHGEMFPEAEPSGSPESASPADPAAQQATPGAAGQDARRGQVAA